MHQLVAVLHLCINLCNYVLMSEMHSEEKGIVPVFDLADRMNKALREGQVSVAEMAEYLGVHRNTLGRYLSGASTPKRQTLRLWALRTGVPFKWLESGCNAP